MSILSDQEIADLPLRTTQRIVDIIRVADDLTVTDTGIAYVANVPLQTHLLKDNYIAIHYKNAQIPVHQLVAYKKYGDLAFRESIQVRHLNGNNQDNSWDNIAIGTHRDNRQDIPPSKRSDIAKYASSFVSNESRKRAAKISASKRTPEQRLELSRKANAKYLEKSKEERSVIALKVQKERDPELRKQIAKIAQDAYMANSTKEERTLRAEKSLRTRGFKVFGVDDVIKMLELRNLGYNNLQISEIFNVHKSRIVYIFNGRGKFGKLLEVINDNIN